MMKPYPFGNHALSDDDGLDPLLLHLEDILVKFRCITVKGVSYIQTKFVRKGLVENMFSR